MKSSPRKNIGEISFYAENLTRFEDFKVGRQDRGLLETANNREQKGGVYKNNS